MARTSGFVVIASNSNRQLACFGTSTGRMFGSMRSADAAAARFEKRHPSCSAISLFVECEEVPEKDHEMEVVDG